MFVWSWLRWPVTATSSCCAPRSAYYFLPDVKQKFKFITPGSVIGTVVSLLGTWGFSVYAGNFGSYNVTYGSIGAVIVLLTWFYITGFIFLMGAEMNAIIEAASPEGKVSGARAPGEAPPPKEERPSAMPVGAADSAARGSPSKGRSSAGGPRASMKSHGRFPRWLRRLLIASAIVVAIVVIIRLVLDPIATHFTRKALRDAEGIRGDFHSVHVTVFPPGYRSGASRSSSIPGMTEASAVLCGAGRRGPRHERAVSRAGGGARPAGRAEDRDQQPRARKKSRNRRVCPTCATPWSACCQRG